MRPVLTCRFFRTAVLLVILCLVGSKSVAAMLFIPMDNSQTDHLKAYGIVYKMLQAGMRVSWLLNYRGGSFVWMILRILN